MFKPESQQQDRPQYSPENWLEEQVKEVYFLANLGTHICTLHIDCSILCDGYEGVDMGSWRYARRVHS
jgi:hypothetical protein